MNANIQSFIVRPLLLAAGVIGIAALYFVSKPLWGDSAPDWKSNVESWPAKPKAMVQKMVDKYGEPNEMTPGMVIWHNNRPWKRTIVYREEVLHRFPMEHTDFVEQFINYDVPVTMFDELAMYDGSIIAERTKGEISARCDKEEANFLAINLAHEIAAGKRNVFTARNFYGETMSAMMSQNKMSPYLQGFVFNPPREGTADPDQPLMKGVTSKR